MYLFSPLPTPHSDTNKQRPPKPPSNNLTVLTTTKPTTSTMAPIYTAKTFDATAIHFGPVEKNKMGGKFIPLTNENGTKTKITLQFPTMHLPFGLSGYREKPEDEPTSYSADLSFRGLDENQNVKTILDKMNALDQHLIDAAHANSVAWFGKQKSRELLEDTYRQLTKVDPSGKYAPMLKAKITMLGDKPNVQIFDTDKTPIGIEDVPRGSTVKVIAEIASVWQVGAGTLWGVTWRAVQILVVEKPNKLTDFAFVDDGDETTNDAAEDTASDVDAKSDDLYDKFL